MSLFQLHQGEALSFLRTLPDASVDAIITDPPYSSGGLHMTQRQQSPVKKYVQTGTQRPYHSFSGDNRDHQNPSDQSLHGSPFGQKEKTIQRLTMRFCHLQL